MGISTGQVGEEYVPASCASTVIAALFGNMDDLDYAADIWAGMSAAGLTGKGATMSTPDTGMHPHGAILDTIDTRLKVGANDDILIIKRNYGGEGVSKSAVANDPEKGWQRAVSLVIRAHQVETWCSIMIATPSSVLTTGHLRADEWVRVVCQGNELSWQAFF
ncbi:hypothetical protein [Candidatus Thiodiazotropha sp. LNASS1]|uniref:hypothetical protein n=1 Tax=Candidatus Thiodiazotropha sp. LNASS1 TaxID=3096260 RepID=UPI00347AD5CF